MKLAKNPVFYHKFSKFKEILLIVLKSIYISLLLKMINGFSWPAKIMASPFNLIPKSSPYSPTFWDMTICVRDYLSSFSGKEIFRNQPYKVSYSYSYGYDRLQKMQKFCGKMFENHGGDRKHSKVCKKKEKVSKLTDESFFTCNCPFRKISLCDLFPALLEWIIIVYPVPSFPSNVFVFMLIIFCCIDGHFVMIKTMEPL